MLLADFLLSSIVPGIAAMGSSRVEEQRVELRGINSQGVDGIEEAGKQGAGTSSADEIQVDPAGDVAASNATAVPQQGAGDQPENERVAKGRQDVDFVFADIENKLKEQDDRENRLAKKYRESKEEGKRSAEKARERLGYNPVSDRDTKDDNSCYIDIKKLVLIESSVIHKKALEEWDRKEKLFAKRVERKSTKVESQKNEVYQLIGFFSVFQGVVLTAVSQSNLLHCNNRWSPILLSLLASIVTFAGVCQKLNQISSLSKTIYSENQALKDVVRRGQALRREGENFVFAQFSEGKKKESEKGYSNFVVVVASIPRNQKSLLTAMSKITLKNNLEGKDVKIREGNAGSSRELCTLKPGCTYDIHYDKNATYREYFFITFPDNTKLRALTSDDFAEYKEISVFEEEGKIDWMGTAERPDTGLGGLVKRFLRIIGLQ